MCVGDCECKWKLERERGHASTAKHHPPAPTCLDVIGAKCWKAWKLHLWLPAVRRVRKMGSWTPNNSCSPPITFPLPAYSHRLRSANTQDFSSHCLCRWVCLFHALESGCPPTKQNSELVFCYYTVTFTNCSMHQTLNPHFWHANCCCFTNFLVTAWHLMTIRQPTWPVGILEGSPAGFLQQSMNCCWDNHKAPQLITHWFMILEIWETVVCRRPGCMMILLSVANMLHVVNGTGLWHVI